VIEFRDVSMVYRAAQRPALIRVTASIGQGEFVFLVGPTGSGKSTVIRLILREEKPTSGRITVLDREIAGLPGRKIAAMRREIGVVFQDFRLLPDRTAAANVAFPLEVTGRSRRDVAALVPETLDLVGLAGKGERLPNELSGGEQQRVAIARAFVGRPRLLLADEPTGNLDPETSVGLMKVLDRINRTGTTVVMATHDSPIVDSMRRRVVELDAGRVVRDQARGVYGYTP